MEGGGRDYISGRDGCECLVTKHFNLFYQLGIRKMTPDGLLLGAKSIVSQNKQLRKELTDLEKEITTLREQNKAMVCRLLVLYFDAHFC